MIAVSVLSPTRSRTCASTPSARTSSTIPRSWFRVLSMTTTGAADAGGGRR